jgi:hypothetical protein
MPVAVNYSFIMGGVVDSKSKPQLLCSEGHSPTRSRELPDGGCNAAALKSERIYLAAYQAIRSIAHASTKPNQSIKEDSDSSNVR